MGIYENLRKKMIQIASAYGIKKRTELVSLFKAKCHLCSEDILLDLGGPTAGYEELSELCKYMIVVNLDRNVLIRTKSQKIQRILGDGRWLPLTDKAVDFVVSNATLEHVPKKDWMLFASEIIRVARKGYFISTPNFWSPIEPHYLIPFFQFVPERVRKFLTKHVQLGWMGKDSYHPISLPKVGELKRLFPNARVFSLGFTYLAALWVKRFEVNEGISDKRGKNTSYKG